MTAELTAGAWVQIPASLPEALSPWAGASSLPHVWHVQGPTPAAHPLYRVSLLDSLSRHPLCSPFCPFSPVLRCDGHNHCTFQSLMKVSAAEPAVSVGRVASVQGASTTQPQHCLMGGVATAPSHSSHGPSVVLLLNVVRSYSGRGLGQAEVHVVGLCPALSHFNSSSSKRGGPPVSAGLQSLPSGLPEPDPGWRARLPDKNAPSFC